MAQRIEKETAEKWQRLAAKLKQISELAGECQMILMLELNVLDGKPKAAIDAIEEAANGQSYMFTPQSEWTGGDNFVVNLPHIAR